ncbi:MAG: PQQ-dependent sugar dehydrogenase [Planctomycetota bacterium]
MNRTTASTTIAAIAAGIAIPMVFLPVGGTGAAGSAIAEVTHASALEIEDAAELYATHCAQCHGEDLNGGNGGSLIDDVWNHGRESSYIYRNTKFGIAQFGMPAYDEVLSDREIISIVRFIQASAGEAALPPTPLPEIIQTRDYDLGVEDWIPEIEGLEIPWGIEFIDDTTALVAERPGRLRVVENGRMLPDPVRGTPEVLHAGQGGLMDAAPDPDYENNGWVYLAFSHALDPSDRRGTGAMTKIVRGKLRKTGSTYEWTDEQTLFEADHDDYLSTRLHYGSRIVFDPDGYLYFAIGDRGRRPLAQELDKPNGKVYRLHPDGRVPSDNPFNGRRDAYDQIYSYGHRNPQGLSIHPDTGRLWITEHGPMGGDEVNLIEPGVNYGWPVISYGINYNGTIITDKIRQDGMRQPKLYWNPSIAPCGMEFHDGSSFPRWDNNLFVSGLRPEEVRRLVIEDENVVHQEVVIKGLGRVRDVGFDRSGNMYVVTNNPSRVLKITNAGRALRQ